MKFSEMAKEALAVKKGEVKPGTYSVYTHHLYNHILPFFADMEVEDIDNRAANAFVQNMFSCKKRDGKPYVFRYVRDCYRIFGALWKVAVEMEWAPERTFKIRWPRDRELPHTRKPVSPEDLERFLKCAWEQGYDNPGAAAFLLAVQTGMRIGECCGLEWADVDFDKGIICVRRTVSRPYTYNDRGKGKSEVVIGTPKTRHSAREIPIAPALLTFLKKLREKRPTTQYVLARPGKMKLVEPRGLRLHFDGWCKRNHLPRHCFHELRHTFATTLITNGIDPKTTADILGHADIKMTMQIYTHISAEKKAEAVNIAFGAPAPEPPPAPEPMPVPPASRRIGFGVEVEPQQPATPVPPARIGFAPAAQLQPQEPPPNQGPDRRPSLFGRIVAGISSFFTR